MKRMQIYLTDKEIESIDSIIEKDGGGTKAEHIRRAIDNYIINKNFKPFIIGSQFVSPGIPAFAKPLPKILDIGKRVRIINSESWNGWEGKITDHYIDADDCSGSYGEHKYSIKKDNGQYFSIKTSDCVII